MKKTTEITDLLPTVQEAIARIRTMSRRQRGYRQAVQAKDAAMRELRAASGCSYYHHNAFINWLDDNHPGWRGYPNPASAYNPNIVED